MSRFSVLEDEMPVSVVAETKQKKETKKAETKKAEPAKKAETKQEKPQEKKAAAPAVPKTTKTASGLTIVRRSEVEDFQKVGDHPNQRKHIPRETVVPREGKRQYERRDGTGRAHEGPKKGGVAGKGNVGKLEDASIKDVPAIDDKEAKEIQTPKPVVEEPPKKTMEEYLAEKKAAKPSIKAPKARTANEGEKNLDKKWGETVLLKNPDTVEEKKPEEKKAEEKKPEEKKAEEKKEKKPVAVSVPLTEVFEVVNKPINEDRPRKFQQQPQEQKQHQPKKQAAKALELTSVADFPALPGK